ncbi:hypothetical protein ACJX0J_037022, partial [Zea mays]
MNMCMWFIENYILINYSKSRTDYNMQHKCIDVPAWSGLVALLVLEETLFLAGGCKILPSPQIIFQLNKINGITNMHPYIYHIAVFFTRFDVFSFESSNGFHLQDLFMNNMLHIVFMELAILYKTIFFNTINILLCVLLSLLRTQIKKG